MNLIKKKPTLPVTVKASPKPPTRPLPVAKNPFEYARTEIPKTGQFLMLYGKPGCGKTTLAAQFPKPLFVITAGETGIDKAKSLGIAPKDIPVVPLPPPYPMGYVPNGGGHQGFIRALETIKAFSNGGHDRRTLVLDTLSGFELLSLQHCASLEFNGDMESRKQDEWNHFASGPRRMSEGYWAGEFLPACVECVEQGYNVVLLGHTLIRPVPNPAGVNYEEFRPELHERVLGVTTKPLHHILFMGMTPEMQDASKKGGKQIVNSKDRFIGLSSDATWYMAKNWENLTEPIFCGDSAASTYSKLTEVIKFQ